MPGAGVALQQHVGLLHAAPAAPRMRPAAAPLARPPHQSRRSSSIFFSSAIALAGFQVLRAGVGAVHDACRQRYSRQGVLELIEAAPLAASSRLSMIQR